METKFQICKINIDKTVEIMEIFV